MAIAIPLALIAPFFEATPASAASPGDFVSRINSLRASKGLPALTVDGRLVTVAQGWSASMASAGKISHNPSLGTSVSGKWSKLGENVGVGGSVDAIFDALVASPGHYKNMVDSSFNSIGVAITSGADGRIFTTHNFATFSGAAAPAPAPAPAKKSASPSPSPAPAAKKSAPVKSAPAPVKAKTTATATAPAPAASNPAPAAAPAPAPVESAPAPPPAPVPPAPSARIVQGLTELGSLSTQG